MGVYNFIELPQKMRQQKFGLEMYRCISLFIEVSQKKRQQKFWQKIYGCISLI